MHWSRRYLVKPGSHVDLKDWDPSSTAGIDDKAHAARLLKQHLTSLTRLQEKLYAAQTHSFLIVLQGMDASGKDGVIKHVMSGINPQGCSVTSFKQPSEIELAHDFLWRVHAAVPRRGMLGIFNRSHYEDVLIARVHELAPRKAITARYRQINDFERMLVENGVAILKFYLHISRDEQAQRFEARKTESHKLWKFSAADSREAAFWPQYRKAYEAALSHCSTGDAPWYVVPADQKWYRDLVISDIVIHTLESLHLRFPRATLDQASKSGSASGSASAGPATQT